METKPELEEIGIVIDRQKDFSTGALKNDDGIANEDRVVEEINKRPNCRWFYTKDTHGPDFKQTLEGVLPEHCIKGTDGWQYDDKVQAALDKFNATCIEKPTFGYLGWVKQILGDGFDPTDQIATAKAAKARINKIYVFGTCTDICVTSNVLILRAMFKDTPIAVIAKACAATPGAQESALLVLERCGIEVIRD